MWTNTLRVALAGVLVVCAGMRMSAQAARPAVHVIGTGGTIGSAGDYWGGNPTRVPIEELVRVPGIDSVATISSEQFLNVASSNIGPERWIELSRRISVVFASRPELRGIIVTHGTDTMEETAYFLDLTVSDTRPVIVTGSMRPSSMAGADGPANLTGSARAAVDTSSRGRGTMVLMDDRLFAAHDVTKTNTTRVETFQAPERGPLAIVDPEGIAYRSKSPGRAAAQFEIGTLRDLPRVDIIYSYAGADSVGIDAAVDAGAKGIVVAGVGRGGMTPSQGRAARRAVARGVVVLISTRAGAGGVPVASRADFIGAGELNPQKARVLLCLTLTRTTDPAQVRAIFAGNQ